MGGMEVEVGVRRNVLGDARLAEVVAAVAASAGSSGAPSNITNVFKLA